MSPGGNVTPPPLTPGQLRALAAAAWRELGWGLGEVSRELARWRERAERIADPTLRADALYSLRNKRTHADGAALFGILPRHRDGDLVRLLVAYETILDYLDEVSERHPTEANGRELHQALLDAVEPERPLGDYYRHHSAGDDDGYLRALVEACRFHGARLPGYGPVAGVLRREVRRAQVLALNHVAPPARRDALLRAWAAAEFPGERELEWFELSAAASASLVVHAMLALAAEPAPSAAAVEATYAAYWPWTSLATAMLDSYVDWDEDLVRGEHSYISHYGDRRRALTRVGEAVGRATGAARAAPRGPRHAVIVGSMVAMYLSKDSARAAPARPASARLAAAGGTLPRLLTPVLLGWRSYYGQRAA